MNMWPEDQTDGMRITITCEDCGRRHRLLRLVRRPGPIWVVCHDCELPLKAVLEEAVFVTPAQKVA